MTNGINIYTNLNIFLIKNIPSSRYIYKLFLGYICFMSKSTILLLFSMVCSTVFAQKGLDTLKVKGVNTVLLGNFYHSFEDKTNALNANQILEQLYSNKFEAVDKDSRVFNKGFTQSTYWLALQVQNKNLFEEYYVWNFYNEGTFFDFFEIKNKKPFFLENVSSHKLLKNRHFSIPFPGIKINFKSDETKLLLVKIKPTNRNNVYTTSDFSTAEDYLLSNQDYPLEIGFFTGFMLLAFLANLFLFILIKDKFYCYLCFYLLFLVMFFVEGHLYDAILYPEFLFKYVTFLPKNVFSNMAIFFGIKVFLLFSNYKEKHPKTFPYISNINLVFLVFNALLFVSSLTLDFQNDALILIREYSNYALYITLTSFLLAISYSIYSKNKLAYAFLFSAILLIISVVSVILNSFGISYFVSVLHLDNISRGFLVQVILLTGFFVYRYKTEKDHFFEEQIKNLEEIEILTLKILNVQEDERKLIARELHDEVGSGLTSIKLMLENYFRKNSSFEEKEMEKKIISTLKTIYEEVRDISHLMMPKSFDELDLKTALDDMILLFQSNNSAILYTFNCVCDFEIVEKNKQIHLYRIIGEIIQNATKHAKATQIDIQLYFENKQIEICIEDNGTGITEKKTNGIGLINVQTRTKFLKGIYNCDSNSNGTVFIIQIPI